MENSKAKEFREQINQLVDQYASLSGLNPARATDTYVSSLFDGYAKTFESSLVGDLNYKKKTEYEMPSL